MNDEIKSYNNETEINEKNRKINESLMCFFTLPTFVLVLMLFITYFYPILGGSGAVLLLYGIALIIIIPCYFIYLVKYIVYKRKYTINKVNKVLFVLSIFIFIFLLMFFAHII